MQGKVRRLFVEKKNGFDIEAHGLLHDLRDVMGITGLSGLRVAYRYDMEGLSDADYERARTTVFSEPPVDNVFDEVLTVPADARVIVREYLPGQYDQRADSAAQCVQIITHGERPQVRTATVFILSGSLTSAELEKISRFLINPVESRAAGMEKPATLTQPSEIPDDVAVLHGFIKHERSALSALAAEMGLAMDAADLAFCQDYFKNEEKRDPTLTEIRIIDTYWSDHCRHTTFLTELKDMDVDNGPYKQVIQAALDEYLELRRSLYKDKNKPACLMDIATISAREMRRKGLLNDLEESDEINACSVEVNARRVDGTEEKWLVMFKNETHNHPTEIEPFGGAATCLGGAIRDPLSGRSYVYQAMRVTGSGDPRVPFSETLPGKLPQRVITLGAAHGYSSYGNQIGLATGQVDEVYHPGYVAKRMEIGAVIGAAPRSSVRREKPLPGDIIVLLGGRTGRDGCGGATGSSKAHTEESLEKSGAEVQKGNAPEERKIQRLFRKPHVAQMIKKCNDFGAGGVSVAIGELADGLDIDLDAVKRKYDGLDGTELAISESQERMAVVLSPSDVPAFLNEATLENLEAGQVAVVKEEPRVTMKWRGRTIVSLSRDFLNSNGASRSIQARIESPLADHNPFEELPKGLDPAKPAQAFTAVLSSLSGCSRMGLMERFDSSIGAGSVLYPYGGLYQNTPAEGMAALLPMMDGASRTASLMTWGFDPFISTWSPFHGAMTAVIDSVARITAMSGSLKTTRLTLQEYFEKPLKDPLRWGKPLSALLGALKAQRELGIPAIGGKDSMSGSFKDLDVPPTLVSFAVTTTDADAVISPEFKRAGSVLFYLPLTFEAGLMPDFSRFSKTADFLYTLIRDQHCLSVKAVRGGGVAEAVSLMAFGNRIGAQLEGLTARELYAPGYGGFIIEAQESHSSEFLQIHARRIGHTIWEPLIRLEGQDISLDTLLAAWENPLESVFPMRADQSDTQLRDLSGAFPAVLKKSAFTGKPRVFIPAFPGTNCEYDTTRAFTKAGGIPHIMPFRNLTPALLSETLSEMEARIRESQIIALPGGFSAGDEPEGSGKFIAAVFRNPGIRDAVMELLSKRDGLMLGICNGFQALIKLGLVPWGEIRDMDSESPTLTFNSIGRHVARIVRTKAVSTLSPWLSKISVGDVHAIPVSHGEGRFTAPRPILDRMIAQGQVAFQYVDQSGRPTMERPDNPNGSLCAIEGITSPDGRVLGKMGHTERVTDFTGRNIPFLTPQPLFQGGVEYFL